jgi:hypothetical protein
MPIVIERNELLQARGQKHRRLRYRTEVEVSADLVLDRATSHDLSAGGMFVDTALDYLPGMMVKLAFTLDRKRFETRARIVHTKPQVGFGAAFLELSSEERGFILRFVHRERATREAERLLRLRS